MVFQPENGKTNDFMKKYENFIWKYLYFI